MVKRPVALFLCGSFFLSLRDACPTALLVHLLPPVYKTMRKSGDARIAAQEFNAVAACNIPQLCRRHAKPQTAQNVMPRMRGTFKERVLSPKMSHQFRATERLCSQFIRNDITLDLSTIITSNLLILGCSGLDAEASVDNACSGRGGVTVWQGEHGRENTAAEAIIAAMRARELPPGIVDESNTTPHEEGG